MTIEEARWQLHLHFWSTKSHKHQEYERSVFRHYKLHKGSDWRSHVEEGGIDNIILKQLDS